MEQGVGEGGGMNKQPRDSRVKEIQQGDAQVHAQAPQQPQKCPRCDSLNTKFCYYNNYSLSQPRYFCKTCRRYWTQGGTLRNVPVGGGCRKGKRAKTSNSSSSSENINSSFGSLPQQQPQGMVVQTQAPSLTSVVKAKDPSSVVASPFYQSGGYFSSLAAMHSLNTSSSHPFDQSLNVVAGSDALRSSNLGLLSGFNVQRPFGQIRPPHLYHQMGSGEREMVSLYEQGLVNPSSSSMANTNTNTNSSGVSQHDWPQSFINNNVSNRASDASLWSTISTTIGGNSERTSTSGVSVDVGAGSSSFVTNQWPNLPGYGPPP